MGLQNQLSDVSSDSVLIFTAALVGNAVRYLHIFLSPILKTLGLFRPCTLDGLPDPDNLRPMYDVVGSGLATLVLLCEQLAANRDRAYAVGPDGVIDSDCVFCLDRPGEGDRVRELSCGHVFHKECLDAWLDRLNLSCPTCRAPLVKGDGVESTQRRVVGDLLAWFPFHG